MPKLILLNPQSHNFFGHSLATLLIGYPNFSKLKYLLDSFDLNLYAIVDRKESSIGFLKKFKIEHLEYYFWKYFLFKRKIKIISREHIQQEDILLITTKNIANSNIESVNKINCLKAISTNHYMTKTKEISNKISNMSGNIIYLSETPTSNLQFFKKYFPKHDELSFGYKVAQRFSYTKSFNERSDKILALGSLTYLEDTDSDIAGYFENLKILTYHPERLSLFKYSENHDEIDSMIRLNNEESFRESFPIAVIKNIYAKIFTKKNSYYSFDLPKKINEHKFVVYPGDIFGNLPQGLYEVMACGSIIFGKDDISYKEAGLVHEHNYISVGSEFSIQNLIQTYYKYKNNNNLLEKISINSLDFASAYKGNLFKENAKKLFYKKISTNIIKND